MNTLRPAPLASGVFLLGIALGLLAGSVKVSAQLAPSRTAEASRAGELSASGTGERDSVFADRRKQDGAALASPDHEPYLSELNQALSSSSKPLELHLVFPGAEELSMREVQFGAAISQALALRAGYRPVLVSRGTQLRTGKFNVLVGTSSELAERLSLSERERIHNGYLSLHRMGAAPDELLLIVSGKTPEKLVDTILSLGMLREQFPDAPHASIREVVLPEDAPFMRRAPLVPGETYTFEQLRKAGAVTEVSSPNGVTMELFIPGYIVTESESPVSINLQYEQRHQPLGSSPTAQVTVNGRIVKPSRAIRGAREGLDFQFPFNWLRAGGNLLQIQDGMGGQASRPPRLKIYGESTLSLPAIDKHPALPDLQLTARTFYPFIGEPSGKDVSIVLGGMDVETVESAWTFLARLAQSANTFFFRSAFTVGELDPIRHNLIIGEYDRLPTEIQQAVALEAFQEEHANTPASQIAQIARGTNLKMLIERWMYGTQHTSAAVSQKVPPSPGDALITNEWAVLASTPSRQNPQFWNLILTSPTNTSLRKRALNIVLPEFWDAVRGDIVLWGNAPGTLRAHIPGEQTRIAAKEAYVEFPTGEKLQFSLWVWSICGLLLLFVITSSWVLGKCDQAVVLRQRKPR